MVSKKADNEPKAATGRKALSPEEKAAREAALKAETKADKFRRLAKMRVPAALAKIKNIGNLGGSGYEYTAEQVAKIETTLNARVALIVERLKTGLTKGAGGEAAKEEFDI